MFLWLEAMLVSKNIPCLILRMSANGRETTVKIAAFKCLQEMVKSNNMWDPLRNDGDIMVGFFIFIVNTKHIHLLSIRYVNMGHSKKKNKCVCS